VAQSSDKWLNLVNMKTYLQVPKKWRISGISKRILGSSEKVA
jgi:hypothetical protein